MNREEEIRRLKKQIERDKLRLKMLEGGENAICGHARLIKGKSTYFYRENPVYRLQLSTCLEEREDGKIPDRYVCIAASEDKEEVVHLIVEYSRDLQLLYAELTDGEMNREVTE